MAIASLIAPFARLSGRITAPLAQAASGAVVAMPDADGRTLLRSFVTPANPQTGPQQQIRAIFNTITEAYQSLSIPQVEAWQVIADTLEQTGRLGLEYSLSWTSLFRRVNTYRLMAGQSIVMDPPPIGAANSPASISLITSDDSTPDQAVYVTVLEAGTPTSGSFLVIRMTRNLGSPVRLARDTDLRFIGPFEAGIIARDTSSPYTYGLDAQSINVLSGTFIGCEIMTLTSTYYPVARLFLRTTTVQSG